MAKIWVSNGLGKGLVAWWRPVISWALLSIVIYGTRPKMLKISTHEMIDIIQNSIFSNSSIWLIIEAFFVKLTLEYKLFVFCTLPTGISYQEYYHCILYKEQDRLKWYSWFTYPLSKWYYDIFSRFQVSPCSMNPVSINYKQHIVGNIYIVKNIYKISWEFGVSARFIENMQPLFKLNF